MMNSLSNTHNEAVQGLEFTAILLGIGFVVTCFIVWLFVLRKYNGKKKRKRKRKHNRINPTLAQTGGLPPRRKPGEPPRGI